MTETFTPEETQLLQPFVTNLDQPIFGLRNLPEVIKGALFSRYSRSEKSLRRILLQEFIQAPEANFEEITGEIGASESQLLAVQKAEAFYNRVLIGYGDDSVAELGGAHLACEGISNIAAKALEDSRIGISPLEKSTRYVQFNRKIDDQYLYCREPVIMASPYANLYETTLNFLFDRYDQLITTLLLWVRQQTPQDQDTSKRAYNSATKAKTLDLLRGLLPMATLTNVGLFGNGRAFEYLLVKLSASPHPELQGIGTKMQSQLDQMIPSFVKRAKSDRGKAYRDYLSHNRQQIQQATQDYLSLSPSSSSSAEVTLTDYDPDGENRVISAILYPHSDLPLTAIQAQVEQLSVADKQQILAQYTGERKVRFHRPGRAFEETDYTFDLVADIGAYRDLQRHRILTQERQRFTIAHGYYCPPELETAGVAHLYREGLEKTATAYETMVTDFPDSAEYLVPFAYHVRWRIKLNLREVYHLVELRSSRQGHPSYRKIAQEIYHQIKAVHPRLVEGLTFVDLNDYVLERLSAEQKLDRKLKL